MAERRGDPGASLASEGSTKEVIAFIGLGIMGGPMAVGLARAGYAVIGYNRSPEKLAQLANAGGRVAQSVGEAAAQADVVITMLPDSPDVEAVVGGTDGVLAHLRAGGLLIDMSTVHPRTSRHIAREGAARGLDVLDAPVSGGEQGAIDGTLSIMVGGPAPAFAGVSALGASGHDHCACRRRRGWADGQSRQPDDRRRHAGAGR